jgi:hypothetical protein
MAYDREWVIRILRQLGYEQEADEAAQVLPDQVSSEELEAFGDKHGISRGAIIDQMGGSP